MRLYIHSPYEILNPSQNFHVTATSSPTTEYTADWTVSDSNINSLSPNQRKCMNIREPQQKTMTLYSRRLCKIADTAEQYSKKCNCRPYYLHANRQSKICNLKEYITCVRSENPEYQADYRQTLLCLNPCIQLKYIKLKQDLLHVTDKSVPSFNMDLILPKIR
ncbi:uncharacterized protein LOC113374946 [Ctenocephalides felis]|uniref:uncharacterized protein LOC113374946 n=1 Tax=Ctenocephalides felis TaxID=7515 RepID=UPI000E6E4D08|nr:uncharacterized protein LOC113374946 [Ctenocephalides felis]